ncbi:MAG: DUF6702 family protein [Bacteroidia bacterium]
MIKKYQKIKIAVCGAVTLLLFAFHPYYISVTDIKYKTAEKSLQISCKIFTNDFETTLRKVYNKPVDILHPKDKAATEKMMANYISAHLKINANNKPCQLNFIGYEKEEEAVWVYFEVKNVALPKSISIENNLLYEYLPAQINMVHTEVKDKKQSSKVANPEKKIRFTF